MMKVLAAPLAQVLHQLLCNGAHILALYPQAHTSAVCLLLNKNQLINLMFLLTIQAQVWKKKKTMIVGLLVDPLMENHKSFLKQKPWSITQLLKVLPFPLLPLLALYPLWISPKRLPFSPLIFILNFLHTPGQEHCSVQHPLCTVAVKKN